MKSQALINMITRAAMGAFMSVGLPRLINWWARRENPDQDPDRPLTPEEQKRAQQAQEMAKRAQDVARITRRLGR